jgi:hypothetical protein
MTVNVKTVEGQTTAVNVKTVEGRRTLTFQSLDDVVADAEKLVSSPQTKVLGNWSLGQLLMHLAGTMNASIDGIKFMAPWYIRLIGPFLKGSVLKKGLSPGFNLPKEREAGAFPVPNSLQEALEKLQKGANRLKSEKATARHPAFGALTHEEWVRLHLRHAEMHLSFAVPG